MYIQVAASALFQLHANQSWSRTENLAMRKEGKRITRQMQSYYVQLDEGETARFHAYLIWQRREGVIRKTISTLHYYNT